MSETLINVYKDVKMPNSVGDFIYSLEEGFVVQTDSYFNEIDLDDICSLNYVFKSAVIDYIQNIDFKSVEDERLSIIFDSRLESDMVCKIQRKCEAVIDSPAYIVRDSVDLSQALLDSIYKFFSAKCLNDTDTYSGIINIQCDLTKLFHDWFNSDEIYDR